MIIAHCVIFKTHLVLLLLNRRSLRATAPSEAFSLTANWVSLWPSLSPTLNWRPPNWRQQPPAGRSHWLQTGFYSGFHSLQMTQLHGHRHLLFHNAHFRLDHVIFFRLFTQVHLWLTACSRVNMQHFMLTIRWSLVSYSGHPLDGRESYLSAGLVSAYSTVAANGTYFY